MTKSIGLAAVLTAILLAPACTDLTEVPQSSITPGNFYRNSQEATGGLASVYAGLRALNGNYYQASEVSTDEMIVPTRGTDWDDGGIWLDLHRQTWGANSPASTTGRLTARGPTCSTVSLAPTCSSARCKTQRSQARPGFSPRPKCCAPFTTMA